MAASRQNYQYYFKENIKMKMTKIAVLLLAVAMVLGVLASCGAAPLTTVKITFLDENNKTVIDTYTAELRKEAPTVLDAVNAVSDAYATMEDYANITLSEDGASVKAVDACKENLTPDAENKIKYWMFLVNGKEPKGDINDVAIADGDSIVFQFQYVENTAE